MDTLLRMLEKEFKLKIPNVKVENELYDTFTISDRTTTLKFQLYINGYHNLSHLEVLHTYGDEKTLLNWLPVLIEVASTYSNDCEMHCLLFEYEHAKKYHSLLLEKEFLWLDSQSLFADFLFDRCYVKALNPEGEMLQNLFIGYTEAIKVCKEKDPVLFQKTNLHYMDEFEVHMIYCNIEFSLSFPTTQSLSKEVFLSAIEKEVEKRKVRQIFAENTPHLDLFFSRLTPSKVALKSLRTMLVSRYSRSEIEKDFIFQDKKILKSTINDVLFYLYPVLDSYVLTVIEDSTHNHHLFSQYEEALLATKKIMDNIYQSEMEKVFA